MNEEKVKKLVMLMLEQNKLPGMLYKYRGVCDKESEERVIRILKNCALYFAKPSTFNDPFDCKIYPDEVSVKWAENIINENAHMEVRDGGIKRENIVDARRIKTATDIVMNGKGVCCMAKSNANIVMWAHYADCHRGLCLGFYVRDDLDFFSIPINMVYTDKYPQLVACESTKDYVPYLIKTKYADWQYEGETRIYKMNCGEQKFSPKSLHEIIFGCQAEPKLIRKIVDVVRSKEELGHVRFLKAEVDECEYKLNILPIEECKL